ncbi:MAG: bifunctional oligoribonuclease/PAP phosphatase NrnA [bacterium]|nr:bifunctional oligoribonuclease/PAP phosphatase NrnA [bacterium]
MINRTEKFLKIGNAIKDGTDFIILAHTNPDGDAVASVLAMGLILHQLDKKFTMVLPDPVPREYLFLPGVSDIEITRELPENIETLIILDCGDVKRIKFFSDAIEKAKTVINIDHHYSNNGYGDLSFIDQESSSVTEILFELFEYHNYPLTREIAICLYTGILTDTGSFKQENSTAKCHFIVSKLLKFQIKPNEIYSIVYEQFTFNQFKLLELGLSTLEMFEDNSIAVIHFDNEMFLKTETQYTDVSEFINFIRLIKDLKVAVICKQMKSGDFRVSMRSKSKIDVSKIAFSFGGGGHPQAAACTIPGKIDEVKQKILLKIKEFIN